MRASDSPIAITDLRGGRNGSDPPMMLPPNQATDAVNVDWKDATLAHKRGGTASVGISGGTANTGFILGLFRFSTGYDGTAELWQTDQGVHVKYLAAGTTWADVTLDDPVLVNNDSVNIEAVSFNNKLFMAYDSGVDRLHVCETGNGHVVRRVGVEATVAAPVASNAGGGGAYPATLRYYRTAWAIQTTNGFIYGEPGPSTAFTPDGAHNYVEVGVGAAPVSDVVTDWQLQISTDNVTFYIVPVVIDYGDPVNDGSAPNSYTDPALPVGTFATWPSVRHLLTDGNRLLGAGSYEATGDISGGATSRIWFSPVLGSLSYPLIGLNATDDERVPNTSLQKNWVDLNEKDGGEIVGLGGPLNGVPWAFKGRQIWKLRPTGDVAAPYLPRKVRDDIGCVHAKSIAMGEDQYGQAALYFMSHRGPYRITQSGDIQYLGRDNEDIWRLIRAHTVGGDSLVPAFSVYYPDVHQWWVWLVTGAHAVPDTKLIFDVQLGFPDEHGQIRGGWARHTGGSSNACCATLFANTLGASMSSDLKPYVSLSGSQAIVKADTSDLTDDGANFQAYVVTRPLMASADLLYKVGVGEPVILAKAQAATSVSVGLIRDFGLDSRVSTVSIAPAGSETRVVVTAEGIGIGEANVVQVSIGDSSALATTWTIDAVTIPVARQEHK